MSISIFTEYEFCDNTHAHTHTNAKKEKVTLQKSLIIAQGVTQDDAPCGRS